MTPAQRELVDKDQYQKYLSSCPASLCEMLLKFEGAIPKDSVQLQDADPGGQDGFKNFVDQLLPNNFTMRKLPQSTAWEFPLADVRAKLAMGVPIGIFLNIPGQVHGWLIDKIAANAAGEEELHLLSKPSESGKGEGKLTVSKTITLVDVPKYKWSDAVFIEKLPLPSTATP